MRRYLVDTNVLSDLVKNADGLAARRTIEVGGSRSVYTSVVVVAEMRFGLAKKASGRLAAQLELVLEHGEWRARGDRLTLGERSLKRLISDRRRSLRSIERGQNFQGIHAPKFNDGRE